MVIFEFDFSSSKSSFDHFLLFPGPFKNASSFQCYLWRIFEMVSASMVHFLQTSSHLFCHLFITLHQQPSFPRPNWPKLPNKPNKTSQLTYTKPKWFITYLILDIWSIIRSAVTPTVTHSSTLDTTSSATQFTLQLHSIWLFSGLSLVTESVGLFGHSPLPHIRSRVIQSLGHSVPPLPTLTLGNDYPWPLHTSSDLIHA
jgi:hypothetical protein